MRIGVALLATAPLALLPFCAAAEPPPNQVQPVPYQPSQPVPLAPPSAPPSAQPPPVPGNDVLHLRNGGLMRGTIVELLPNDHATLLLPTGQSAIVQWSAIERVERNAPATAAPTPTPSPAASSLPPAPSPRHPPDTILVHIQSTRTVTLERRSADGVTSACTTPCDQWLPVSDTYRVTGRAITSSGWFGLDGQPGDRVVLSVSTGTKVGFYAGGVVATGGVVLDVLGLMTLAAAKQDQDSTDPNLQSQAKGTAAFGGLLLVGGVAMTVVGLYVLFTNLHSDQTQEVDAPVPPPPPPGGMARNPLSFAF